MKKLMIAAAIVCAAACVQASSVLWSSGTTILPGIGGNGWDSTSATLPEEVSGYTMTVAMWALNAETSQWEAMAISGNTASETDFLGTLSGEVITETNLAANKAYRLQATIVRASDGATLTSQLLEITWDGGMDDFSFEVASQDALAGGTLASVDGTFSDTTGYWQASGWQSVPEPTSGLLLLIGVAGLALRRRRA